VDVSVLSSIPLFSSLKDDFVNDIAQSLSVRNYRQNQVVFHQGDPGSTLFIITSGQVKITISNQHGEEVLLAILGENECFGEISVFDGMERTATAMTTAETVCLHRDQFLDIVMKHPQMATDVFAALSRRLRQADIFVQDAIFMNIRSRLAKKLVELADQYGQKTDRGIVIDLNITQQELADAIGASRVAVNIELGILQESSIIDINRKQITVLLPQKLQEYY